MIQLMTFATHSVITEEECPLGYLLLRCLRLFLVLDMYTALEVHTEDTIARGCEAVQAFGKLIKVSTDLLHLPVPDLKNFLAQEYIDMAAQDENFGGKNWDFIKAHLPQHIFDDVRGKGATRNYNTKPNEKLHGPLKDAYRDQTNFKDVATQVSFQLGLQLNGPQTDVIDTNEDTESRSPHLGDPSHPGRDSSL